MQWRMMSLIAGILFPFLFLACSKSSVQKQNLPPGPFTIGLAQGGGFTGMETGYHLDKWGNLLAYRRLPGAEEEVSGQALVRADSADYWYVRLIRAGAAPANYLRKGDVYRKIYLSEGDSTRIWLWNPADTEGVPSEILTFYSEFLGFCQRHLQKKQK